MRRAILSLMTMGAALLLANGVALAITTINCKVGDPCHGTSGKDNINDSKGSDEIHARGGYDLLRSGVRIRNSATAESGDDVIYGQGGPDDVWIWDGVSHGRPVGPDKFYGGPGKDWVISYPGENTISGGPGNDRIEAANGVRDVINCGGGNDRVEYNEGVDTIRGCERKISFCASCKSDRFVDKQGHPRDPGFHRLR
jgi:Ca2+-binding RTX toxin-like protein